MDTTRKHNLEKMDESTEIENERYGEWDMGNEIWGMIYGEWVKS